MRDTSRKGRASAYGRNLIASFSRWFTQEPRLNDFDAPPLRIAINAQLPSQSGTGGAETVLRVLTALTHLDDGPERYVFVGPNGDPNWLQPYLAPGHTTVQGPPGPGWMAGSSSFFNALGCDVVHFPFQVAFSCRVPTVYNPHDLQHRHYPEFFDRETIAWRESAFPIACRAAHTVAVASQFVKRDVVRAYGLDPDKVQVIPWAPLPTNRPADSAASAEVDALRAKYALGNRPVALYPAMTWAHKNHLRLLDGFALMRDRGGADLMLVCTGHKTEFWPQIERRIEELELAKHVRFPGLVPHGEVSAFYQTSQFLMLPTLFEAASGPVFEAWQHGLPVACSAVTSLPEQVAKAALLFDPLSVEAIAEALGRMTRDSALRSRLEQLGTERFSDFDVERTLKAYRAVYRRAAGRTLSEEDRVLLAWDWMHDPSSPASQPRP